jgi:protein-S-isoprenylcysteine O-methyltransferase Ste14
MNPWFAKAAFLAATAVMIAIRAPHGQRSRTVRVATTRRGGLEALLLAIAWTSFFVPLIWVASPLFSFAEYPLLPAPFVAGVAILAVGLWLFKRSHDELGANWSITLEVREGHTLVTHGLYRRIRHPMYLSLFVYAIGQALVIPNWIAGPSYLVAMVLLIVFRLGPEERMMAERFGPEWDAYRARTSRLLPGIY